jgi:hypothetical protein
MAESPWPADVELSDYLVDLDSVQLKVRVPPPVVVLVAALMRRVPRRVGVKTPGELIAALMVRALADDDASLGEAVGDYRETRAHVVLNTDQTEGEFVLPPRSDLEL